MTGKRSLLVQPSLVLKKPHPPNFLFISPQSRIVSCAKKTASSETFSQTTSDASLGPYSFSRRPYFMAFPERMIAEKRCDKYSLGYAKTALPMLIRESQNSLPRQHNGANVSSYRASFRRSLLRIVFVTQSFQ